MPPHLHDFLDLDRSIALWCWGGVDNLFWTAVDGQEEGGLDDDINNNNTNTVNLVGTEDEEDSDGQSSNSQQQQEQQQAMPFLLGQEAQEYEQEDNTEGYNWQEVAEDKDGNHSVQRILMVYPYIKWDEEYGNDHLLFSSRQVEESPHPLSPTNANPVDPYFGAPYFPLDPNYTTFSDLLFLASKCDLAYLLQATKTSIRLKCLGLELLIQYALDSRQKHFLQSSHVIRHITTLLHPTCDGLDSSNHNKNHDTSFLIQELATRVIQIMTADVAMDSWLLGDNYNLYDDAENNDDSQSTLLSTLAQIAVGGDDVDWFRKQGHNSSQECGESVSAARTQTTSCNKDLNGPPPRVRRRCQSPPRPVTTTLLSRSRWTVTPTRTLSLSPVPTLEEETIVYDHGFNPRSNYRSHHGTAVATPNSLASPSPSTASSVITVLSPPRPQSHRQGYFCYYEQHGQETLPSLLPSPAWSTPNDEGDGSFEFPSSIAIPPIVSFEDEANNFHGQTSGLHDSYLIAGTASPLVNNNHIPVSLPRLSSPQPEATLRPRHPVVAQSSSASSLERYDLAYHLAPRRRRPPQQAQHEGGQLIHTPCVGSAPTRSAHLYAIIALMNLSCGGYNNKAALASCPPVLNCFKKLLLHPISDGADDYSVTQKEVTGREMLKKMKLYAAITLRNLSFLEANHATLVQFPGLIFALGQVVSEAAAAVQIDDSTSINEHICMTLTNLSAATAHKASIYHTPGIMQALMTVVLHRPPLQDHLRNRHYGKARVQAFSVLSNVAISYDNKFAMYYYPGLVHAMIEIMAANTTIASIAASEDNNDESKRYNNDLLSSLLSKACSIVWSLAAEKRIQVPLVHEQRRVVPALVRLVNISSSKHGEYGCKCWAALCLLAESPQNCLPLIRAGIMTPLLKILSSSYHDPAFSNKSNQGSSCYCCCCASWCISCLMNLAHVDEAAYILRQEGVMDLLSPIVVFSNSPSSSFSTTSDTSTSHDDSEYASLKAAMVVALICRRSVSSSTPSLWNEESSHEYRHYYLLRKMESAIPSMISILYNTLAGRGGPGYKHGVFSVSCIVACMAALCSGPEFWQERVCASVPLMTQLLQVVWDFGVDGGIPGSPIVGGGRDDIRSTHWALEALHSMVAYQRRNDLLSTDTQHLVGPLLWALTCAEKRLALLSQQRGGDDDILINGIYNAADRIRALLGGNNGGCELSVETEESENEEASESGDSDKSVLQDDEDGTLPLMDRENSKDCVIVGGDAVTKLPVPTTSGNFKKRPAGALEQDFSD